MRSLIWALVGLTAVNALSVSKNAHCGKAVGLTCKGSAFGNCCSKYNYCGSTSAYCGTGCQSKYGSCSGTPAVSTSRRTSSTSTRRTTQTSSRTSSTAAASSTGKVSVNARCGYLYAASPGGMTCSGSQWGNCCSQYSYCGSTEDYCGKGCQAGFGKCNSVSSSSKALTSSSSSSFSSASSSTSSETPVTTQSTEIPSSSSSSSSTEPSSSTTEAESSSTTSSQEPSTTTASSTTETSTVSSTSSTSMCLATPTNAVRDGSFESGTLNTGSGWTTVVSGIWEISSEQNRGAQDGTHILFALTPAWQTVSFSLINQNVPVLSGTTVSCKALAAGTRYDAPGQGRTTFQIFLDGTPCTDIIDLRGDIGWVQYGKDVQVVGDSHELRIDVVSTGENEAAALITFDKVEVLPLSGPGAVPSEVPCPAEPTST